MKDFSGFRPRVLFFFLVLACTAAPVSGLDSNDAEFRFWLNLLGSEEQLAIENLGTSFTEIDPELLSSRADRVLWYSSGVTVWVSAGQVVQIRFDAPAEGTISGISMGSTAAEVKSACGEPWIESEGSFYYNLPWRSGPARMRFVFDSGGEKGRLREVYLFLVR